jgi:uncharacterized membrane protein
MSWNRSVEPETVESGRKQSVEPNEQRTTNNEQRDFLWPAVLLLSTGAICALTFANVQSPLRGALALWFLLICPGLALVRLLRIGGILIEWMLTITVSIALDTGVATVMVYAGQWSPNRGLAVLAVITVAGAVLQLQLHERKGASRQVAV